MLDKAACPYFLPTAFMQHEQTGNPVDLSWGLNMRKGTLLLAMLLAVGLSTTADAAKKKKAAPAPKTAAELNASSTKLVGDGLSQILVPAQSLGTPKAAPAKSAKRSSKKKRA